jgi:hypothetical protein
VHQRSGDRRSEAEVAELPGELQHRLGQPRQIEQALAIWRDLSADPSSPHWSPG